MAILEIFRYSVDGFFGPRISRYLHHAENQLLKALPKMAKAAANPALKAGFTEHLAQTKGHVSRLTQALKILGLPAKGKPCHAMQGLVEEGGEAIRASAGK